MTSSFVLKSDVTVTHCNNMLPTVTEYDSIWTYLLAIIGPVLLLCCCQGPKHTCLYMNAET